MTNNERNMLIENYIPLANKMAWKKSRATPKSVDFEALQSAAYYGLVDAANKYNSPSVSFGTYARFRIAGEMCDYLRELAWGARNDPFIPLSIHTPELSDILWQEDESPHDFFDKTISNLGNVARRVVRSYCIGYTLREIGKQIGLCESRISQILTQAKRAIRNDFSQEELLAELESK